MTSKKQPWIEEMANLHANDRCPGMDDCDIIWSMCFNDFKLGALALAEELEKFVIGPESDCCPGCKPFIELESLHKLIGKE